MRTTTKLTDKQKGARAELVHPKFVNRWARRYLKLVATVGRAEAIKNLNSFLNPADAKQVGEEARRIQHNPNQGPKSSA